MMAKVEIIHLQEQRKAIPPGNELPGFLALFFIEWFANLLENHLEGILNAMAILMMSTSSSGYLMPVERSPDSASLSAYTHEKGLNQKISRILRLMKRKNILCLILHTIPIRTTALKSGNPTLSSLRSVHMIMSTIVVSMTPMTTSCSK